MSRTTVSGKDVRLWLRQALRAAVGDLPTAAEVKARYMRTVIGTQVMIVLVTLAVLLQSRTVGAPLVFFGIMQLGAVIGAFWAARIKNKIERGHWVSRA